MGSKKKGSKGKTWKNQIRMEEPIDKSLTKDQLKAELKKRGLRTSGSKSELLQRLEKKIPTVGASAPSMPVTRRKPDSMTTQHSNGTTPPGRRSAAETAQREAEKKEREHLVLWRKPIKTIYYSALETINFLKASLNKMLQHRILVTIVLLLVSGCVLLINVRGPHQKVIQPMVSKAWWCVYWVGLGVLSSVGLGTGLHTFLLYLGPHIASVTLAAYECQSLDFPSPPYPDEIMCPENVGSSSAELWQGGSSVWAAVFAIMAKVRLEAFMWGAGTALGELPPYFMARAARLSGLEPDEEEEELRDFEELQRKRLNQEQMTLYERAKLKIEQLVEKVGFFGILACASIPNPLFDLAGITCGHFLVPFWTFFGATLIGKAVVKMHIQKLFVIIAFNEPLIETAVLMLGRMPYVGPRLQEPFKEFLVRQKTKLHRKTGSRTPGDAPAEASMLSSLFEKFVIAMVLYFVVSIVNSLAQAYHKRLHKRSRGDPKLARD